MLTSTATAKVYTKVADRLEYIETLLGKSVQTPARADTINVNWSLGGIRRVILNRPVTTFSFLGGYDRQRLILELVQDDVGGRLTAFFLEVNVLGGSDLPFPIPLTGDPTN